MALKTRGRGVRHLSGNARALGELRVDACADLVDGPLNRENGIFTFEGKNAETKSALVNWGIAAIVYLVVGKILDRVIRP